MTDYFRENLVEEDENITKEASFINIKKCSEIRVKENIKKYYILNNKKQKNNKSNRKNSN